MSVVTTHRGATKVDVEEGIEVVRLPRLRGSGRLETHAGVEPLISTVPAVARHLARGRFEVVHAFSFVSGYAAACARSFGGPPVVLSLMGTPRRQSLELFRLRRQLLRTATKRAAATTVLSEAAASAFRRDFGAPVHVLPGGVFCADFETDLKRARNPTLICAASLDDPRKRGALLTRAFERLRAKRPDVKLLLAGSRGPVRGARLDLPTGTEWIDADSTTVLAGAYATAWASVLPSVDEAFGLVLIESLAAGTPVVAAHSGASAEIVTNSAIGRLFGPDDEAELAHALDEALELGKRPETVEACGKHAQAYDWPRIIPRYEALYREATGRRAPSPTEPRNDRP